MPPTGLPLWIALRASSPWADVAPPPVETPEVVRALRLERIDILGREQVSLPQIQAILRAEGLVPGTEISWPSDPRIDSARDRLRATGYFSRVTLRVEPVAGSRTRVVLAVDLAERSSVVVSEVYLGSSRMTPFHGGLDVVERNLLGRGVHLGGAFVWATQPRIERARRQQAYQVYAEVPRLGKTKLGVDVSGWFRSAGEPYRVSGADDDPNPEHFRGVDYSRVGGRVGMLFQLAPQLRLAAGYRFERVTAFLPSGAERVHPDGTLEPIDFDLQDGAHRLTTARLALTFDGRDDAFLAGHGGRFGFEVQASSPAIGSSYEYIYIVAGGGYSFRLPWGHWLTPGASGGQIAGQAPVFERFYAGDLSAWTPGRVMGLRYSTRNPIDVFKTGADEVTFGSLFGTVDLQYAWPLFRRTRTRVVFGGDLVFSFGVFVVAGDRSERAARRDAGLVAAPVGMNADLGVRIDTAIGTFDFSVGNVLRRVPL